ncbi:MAG: hypothetical protein G01um101425_435 [Candidatus Peregrinibacteria bacterium Gr01-1014_25]|nr:MAG: hypothetical protein G01um101425_435 [Candidatus Peregrinibacteria bacterium Gr01-1014_25]
MTTDDTTPVTRRDLKEFGDGLRKDLRRDLRRDLRNELGAELRAEMRSMNAENLQQMMVLFEGLRHDVFGVVRDAVSIFRDGHGDHERRIRRLERRLNLAA